MTKGTSNQRNAAIAARDRYSRSNMHVVWQLVSLAVVLYAIGANLTLADVPQGDVPHGDVPRTSDTRELRSHVRALIAQLGAQEYVLRERAANQLRRIGLAAFDELVQAQTHDDAEIRLRAQNLIHGFRIGWVLESDVDIVKRLLEDYQNLPPTIRSSRITWISSLEDGVGLDAACRIARFEQSELLSKQAALQVMRYDLPEDVDVRHEIAGRIRRTVGSSQRPGSQWLRTYAQHLTNPAQTLDAWATLVAKEEAKEEDSSRRGADLLLPRLLRWYAEMLVEQAPEQVEAVASRAVKLETRQPENLVDVANWLVDLEAWSLFDDLAARFPKEFSEEPLHVYCRAEALAKQEQQKAADQLAATARKLGPQREMARGIIAGILQQRGRIEWSVAEYRRALDLAEPGSLEAIRIRTFLAELLHDQARELDAAEALKPLVDLAESNPAVAGRLRSIGDVRPRMHYFYAEHFRQQADRQSQVSHLQKAIAADPTDADVLIAMFRLPHAEQSWEKRTRGLIKKAAEVFERELEETRRDAERDRPLRRQSQYNRELARTHNQLAWLIGNTEGDFQEAVEGSRRSLELRPQTAGYLDTLARCYFAKKEYDNAVKYQRRAVELEPHSGQIQRQLIEFEEVLAKQVSSAGRSN